MKDRNGFTLVELLAVIAILAILVIIALPNVINMYNKAQKETFLTEAKKVYSESEKKFISNSISNKQTKIINSEDSTKLDMTGKKLQYCIILNNNGKVNNMKVSNGKWIASLDNNKSIEDLTIDDLEEGNLDDYNCTQNAPNVPKPIYCTFDGEMVQGAEYVNGQYTYRYKQQGAYSSTTDLAWNNIGTDGWGVQLTDKTSTDPVTSKVCTFINDKPVVSMDYMFYDSQAASIDLSKSNTKNVISISYMFKNSQATSIDLSSFNTSKVTSMYAMFSGSKATTINVSKFNTSNVINMSNMFFFSKAAAIDVSNFNTSNVTNMTYMFAGSKATTLDLSNFDTSKVTDMSGMFANSQATSLDLSSFDTSKVTNMGWMFYDCKVKTIYVSNKFVTDKVTGSSYMFSYSTNLVGGNGTKYKDYGDDITYARIDTATTPGYFTKK